jgi:hypothetical protein
MIRQRTSLILNHDLIGISGWLSHVVKRQNVEILTQIG